MTRADLLTRCAAFKVPDPTLPDAVFWPRMRAYWYAVRARQTLSPSDSGYMEDLACREIEFCTGQLERINK